MVRIVNTSRVRTILAYFSQLFLLHWIKKQQSSRERSLEFSGMPVMMRGPIVSQL